MTLGSAEWKCRCRRLLGGGGRQVGMGGGGGGKEGLVRGNRVIWMGEVEEERRERGRER